MSIVSISTEDFKEDEEMVISKRKQRKKPTPLYSAIGARNMDGISIIADMTPQEAFVFKKIVKLMDYRDNIAEFNSKELTSTERRTFHVGYKRLVLKSVLIRIKKGSPSIYMVNPDLIQPKDYHESLDKWNNYA